MATFTTILGLKVNDESDSFSLADFTGNWRLLDQSPGIFICSSTSRPNWGPDQAGRFIFMNDLKARSFWDGASWNDEVSATPFFASGQYLNTPCAAGQSTIEAATLTFTTPRPSALAILMTATYNWVNTQDQDAWQSILFDGVKQLLGNWREQIRCSGDRSDNGHTAGINVCSFAMIPSVTAGQHQIGLQVDVSGNYRTPITLIGVKTMALVASFSSSNVL